jgi:hypothetical protein
VQERLFAHFGIASARDTPVGPALCGGGTWRGVEALVELFDRLDMDGIFSIAPPYIGPPLRVGGGLL